MDYISQMLMMASQEIVEQFTGVADGFVAVNSSGIVYVYARSGDSLFKLDPPNGLNIQPSGANGIYGMDFSPDGTYLAIAYLSSPRLYIYKRSGNVFTKLPDPPDLPEGPGYNVTFSADGVYLAVTGNSSSSDISTLAIYRRSNDTFNKLTSPNGPDITTRNASAYAIAFSPDSTYLVQGSSRAPYLNFYKRSGDSFLEFSGPVDLGGSSLGVAFSPDGTHLAVGSNYNPYLKVYQRSGDTFTLLNSPSGPDVLPINTAYDVAYSPDGVYLAVAQQWEPFLSIYKRSGNTYTKLNSPNGPDVLPSNTCRRVAFSANGTYLVVASWLTEPHLLIYKRSFDQFNKLPDPSSMPVASLSVAIYP